MFNLHGDLKELVNLLVLGKKDYLVLGRIEVLSEVILDLVEI